MSGQRGKRPVSDFTGRQQQKLQEEHSAEIAAREAEIGMIQAAEAASDELIDAMQPNQPVVIEDEDVVEDVTDEAPAAPKSVGNDAVELEDEVVTVEATVSDMRPVEIRINEDINPTIGVGNHYEFKAGKRYRVPAFVAAHLDEKGYVWH